MSADTDPQSDAVPRTADGEPTAPDRLGAVTTGEQGASDGAAPLPAEPTRDPADFAAQPPAVDRADSAARPPAVDPTGTSRLARAFAAAPDRLLIGFLALCVVVAAFLQLHQFRWFYVLPAAVIVIVLTRRWMPSYHPMRDCASSGRAAAWGGAIALAMAAAWLIVNLPHADQMLYSYRDPQMYLQRGLYLVGHPSPVVSVRPETVTMAKQVGQVYTSIYGGAPSGISPTWGTSLLPGLIGLTGWFGGQYVAMHADIIVGAIGLVALYAAGRRLLGPLWALLPVIGLGVAMPLAGLSRQPFSEPAAMVLFCGAMTVLWAALRHRSVRWAALAGVFAGAVTFSRIDGPLVVVGGLACLGCCGLLAVSRRARRRLLWMVVAFAVAGGVLMAWAFVDMTFNSDHYLRVHNAEWHPLVIGTAVVAVIALLVTFNWRWLRILAVAISRRRVGFAWIGGGVVLALAIAMLTRPLWWAAYNDTVKSYMAAAKSLQKSQGLPIEPHRSYDEWQIFWQGWYFGYAVLAMAIVGSVLIVMEALRHRKPQLAAWIALPGTVGALYLVVRVSGALAVDQIFIERRFLPEVVPGMLVIAAYFARVIVRRVAPGGVAIRWGVLRRPAAAVLSLGAVVAFVVPVTTWGPLFPVTHAGGLGVLARDMCNAAPSTRAIYAGNPDSRGIAVYLGTLQKMCGLDAVWVKNPTADRLAEVVTKWKGSGPIAVYALDPNAVSWTTGSSPPPLSEVDYQTWGMTIMRPPNYIKDHTATIWAGILQPSGTVRPVAPATTR